MKPTAIVIALVFLAIALVASLLPRTAVAAPDRAGETYLILSVARGQTDAQLEGQLNDLAADGWRVRCALPNGVIMAR